MPRSKARVAVPKQVRKFYVVQKTTKNPGVIGLFGNVSDLYRYMEDKGFTNDLHYLEFLRVLRENDNAYQDKRNALNITQIAANTGL